MIKGMDVSMVNALEQHGARFSLNGAQEDVFSILRRCGTNMIRLRLWYDPYSENGVPYGGGGNDLETTIALAKRAVKNHMDVLLDFHYSDFWADPSKQVKPKAWQHLSGALLEREVYRYTAETLRRFRAEQIAPAMVQIGNEITNGLLWPDGKAENPEKMAALLAAGVRAVREVSDARIMFHLDFGTNNELYRKWFSDLEPFAPDYDVIGMSYYPHWNGKLSELLFNMNDISARCGKDVVVAETSIGYTTDTLGCTGVVYSRELEKATGYPATPEGQEQFLRELYATVRSVKNGRGIGVFYWEPTWIAINECTWADAQGSAYMNDKVEAGNSMANQALFDREGNANRALVHLSEY